MTWTCPERCVTDQYLPLTFSICLASSNVMPALALAAAWAAPARPPPALRAASWLAAYSCLRAFVSALPTICDPMIIIWTIYLAMVKRPAKPRRACGHAINVIIALAHRLLSVITTGRRRPWTTDHTFYTGMYTTNGVTWTGSFILKLFYSLTQGCGSRV